MEYMAHSLTYMAVPRSRTSWFARAAVMSSFVGLTLAGMRWLRPLTWDLSVWRAQQQCLRYLGPADAVAKGTPACWSFFFPVESHSGEAVFFLHERVSPGGRRRLVVVPLELSNLRERAGPRWFFEGTRICACEVVPPWSSHPGLQRDPSVPNTYLAGVRFSDEPNLEIGIAQSVQVFNGQPDPLDASHFTIRYAVDGKQRFIDGWLQDDDTVRLSLRDGTEPDPD